MLLLLLLLICVIATGRYLHIYSLAYKYSKVALTLSGAHTDAIYSLDWSNDGAMIATGGADKTVWYGI